MIIKHEAGNTLTAVQKTDPEYHRSKFIIHGERGFYFAEFATLEQLDFFAEMLGFDYRFTESMKTRRFGEYNKFTLTHRIDDHYDGGFWRREDVPAEARPFKALSNGSIVTCYFTNDGETIRIYRPNPNAKNVYRPLETEAHIQHHKIYGSY